MIIQGLDNVLAKMDYHFMQAHLYDDKYVMLIWPKGTPLKWLDVAKETVNLQLDNFRASAARDEPRREYARIEVESWNKAISKSGDSDA